MNCPQCGCSKTFKDGVRYLSDGVAVQRYICRQCSYRFSEHLKTSSDSFNGNQICAIEAKNLEPVTEQESVVGESQLQYKKIEEHKWWLKKNGRSEATIDSRIKLLKTMVKRGANLYDPESVKDVIAKQDNWGNGRKNNAVDAYSAFLKMMGGRWDPPAYKVIRKLPFIPKETEIDQLIAGCNPRMATFLQLLKETGARCGEIWWLKWEDIDFESKVVNITPEKNSNPRVVRLSNKMLNMLQQLPKIYGDRVFSFPNMPVDHFGT